VFEKRRKNLLKELLSFTCVIFDVNLQIRFENVWPTLIHSVWTARRGKKSITVSETLLERLLFNYPLLPEGGGGLSGKARLSP
jgi:hypothetical protein